MNQVLTRPGGPADEAGLRYTALMDVLERRGTARSFDARQPVSEASYRMILDAARLAPSGANTQPWHFIAATDPVLRAEVARLCEQAGQTDHRGAATAPGCLVVATDFRLTWAYPGVLDATELDQRYHATAERIILQSVAAALTAAHLAAAALGYHSWWISVLGKDDTQAELGRLLGIPPDLTITDVMLFGIASPKVKKRWKKQLDEIASWNRFDRTNYRTLAQIDAWLKDLQERLNRRGGFLRRR